MNAPTPRHRRRCACFGDQTAPADVQQVCTAHGTAVHLARGLIAATYPGTWFIGGGEYTTDPDGLFMEMDLADVEWSTAWRMRHERAANGRPVDHLDVYLAVLAELLPARQRRALERRRVLSLPRRDTIGAVR